MLKLNKPYWYGDLIDGTKPAVFISIFRKVFIIYTYNLENYRFFFDLKSVVQTQQCSPCWYSDGALD